MTTQNIDSTSELEEGLYDHNGSWWDDMPSVVDSVPREAEQNEASSTSETVSSTAQSAKPSRRRFIQGVMAVGGALSLNVLQALSGVKLRPASARVGTEFTDCAGYETWSGYDDDTLICVGAEYSKDYCGDDYWFKDGWGEDRNSYYQPLSVCGYGTDGQRSAWQWSTGTDRYRCADGLIWTRSSREDSWTGPVFKICNQWLGLE